LVYENIEMDIDDIAAIERIQVELGSCLKMVFISTTLC
jgi:hypothetical protein